LLQYQPNTLNEYLKNRLCNFHFNPKTEYKYSLDIREEIKAPETYKKPDDANDLFGGMVDNQEEYI